MKINPLNQSYTQKTSFKASLLEMMNNKYSHSASSPASVTNNALPGGYAPVSTPVANQYAKVGNLISIMMQPKNQIPAADLQSQGRAQQAPGAAV